ncbi:ATP-binding protein [Alteromonas sp. KUL49]|uniref:ATP-binding protein n=1 Tax=Alteromonas sp. KUL49 TaxID=2480798 RepID=UPI00102F23AC|nr:ATP-binding protein [Alteromonas sp. KUL49]TAP35528.1 ATP-binding protein [Alteromonas sp. KUL49]GEA13409.1 HDIG domain-containing protein [Alteromonas sp. KUL49]
MDKVNLWLNTLARSHSPDFSECLAVLGSYFPLLHDFESTEQDNEWHAEGNVAIHTNMVLKALYQLLENNATHIHGEQRLILILAALLHDIAKPISTVRREINGIERVVASRHEAMGMSYLATRLPLLGLSQQSIESIMGLVGHHQMPKLLVIKNKGYGDYLQLALNTNLELMYWLELADMQGRICKDKATQIELLEQFRMFAEDYGLWEIDWSEHELLSSIQIKTSPDEQIYTNGCGLRQLAFNQIYQIEEAIAKNFEASQQYSHLFLMCGVSGSGKSTWIQRNLEGVEVVSLDDIREELNGKRECQKNKGQVLQLAKQRLKAALAKKQSIVWDATNLRTDFREMICQIGMQYNALTTIVAFQLSTDMLIKNNAKRKSSVPDKVLHQQIERFQWPSRTEAHRMLVIDNQGVELSRHGSFSLSINTTELLNTI